MFCGFFKINGGTPNPMTGKMPSGNETISTVISVAAEDQNAPGPKAQNLFGNRPSGIFHEKERWNPKLFSRPAIHRLHLPG